MSGDRRYRPETLAVHLGLEPDAETGAVVPPLHLATTFERDADGSYPRGFVYARPDNPNRAQLERDVQHQRDLKAQLDAALAAWETATTELEALAPA